MDSLFDVFQILAITLYLSIIFGRTLFLIRKKHTNPISLGFGKKGLNQVIELIFLAALIVWIVEVLQSALHVQFHIFPSIIYTQLIGGASAMILGAFLVFLSFGIFIWALASFRDSWRIGIDTQTNGKLITTGIFAYSRNPIFLSIDLYFGGTFLINGTLIFLLFAILVVVGMHYQILQEEKFLSKYYGSAYQEYIDITDRYWGQHHISKDK